MTLRSSKESSEDRCLRTSVRVFMPNRLVVCSHDIASFQWKTYLKKYVRYGLQLRGLSLQFKKMKMAERTQQEPVEARSKSNNEKNPKVNRLSFRIVCQLRLQTRTIHVRFHQEICCISKSNSCKSYGSFRIQFRRKGIADSRQND